MGAYKMTAYYDFFYIYIMDIVETSFQFYFLIKILKKKPWPPFYFLFAVCAVIINDFLPIGTIMGFMAIVLLLIVCGTFVCHADVKSSLLYAVLTTEIMLLCYGITQQLISLAAPFLPAAFHDMTGIAFMLASQEAAFVLAGFCYYMVYRYFSMDALYSMDAFHPLSTAAKMQQIFLVFIPVLMIFIMSRYVNTMQFDFQQLRL